MTVMRRGFFAAYILTGFLALCFCVMGAGVMYDNGIAPKTGAADLASQIIDLYRQTLGPVPAFLAGVSALCVMATTMIAALDGIARAFDAVYQEYLGSGAARPNQSSYTAFLVILAGLGVAFLALFMRSFSTFIDLVTSIYFIVGPVIALLNHLVVTRCEMPDDDRPSEMLRVLNLFSTLAMSVLAAMFFVLKSR